MTKQPPSYERKGSKSATMGHLGQKKARSEKRSEEKLRHMGDSSASHSLKQTNPKRGKDQAKRGK